MKLFLLICISFFTYIFAGNETFESKLNNYNSSYLRKQFTDKINREEIDFILEIGVCEAWDSILIHKYYNCPVYSFECNPHAIPRLKASFANFPQIHLIEKAVTDVSGIIDFYDSYWTGDSSIYQFDLDVIKKNNGIYWDGVKHMYDNQKKIQVSSIRLDDWCNEHGIDEIGLICMDVQGAELNVLKGLGKHLQKVKYIITEVEYRPIYKGEALFEEVFDYMTKNGFECVGASSAEASVSDDVLFIRKDLLPDLLPITVANQTLSSG